MTKVFVEYKGGLIDADKIETIEHKATSTGRVFVHGGSTRSPMIVAEIEPQGGPLAEMTDSDRDIHSAIIRAAAHSLADAIGSADSRARQESSTYIVRYSNDDMTWLYAQARHNESGVGPYENPKGR